MRTTFSMRSSKSNALFFRSSSSYRVYTSRRIVSNTSLLSARLSGFLSSLFMSEIIPAIAVGLNRSLGISICLQIFLTMLSESSPSRIENPGRLPVSASSFLRIRHPSAWNVPMNGIPGVGRSLPLGLGEPTPKTRSRI